LYLVGSSILLYLIDDARSNKNKVHLKDPGVDGRIILRWIFRRWDGRVCTGLIWLRIGTVGGHL